jgi:hypothetical protein
VVIILEGAASIAGVGLLALTFQVLSNSKVETQKGIEKINLMIKNLCHNLKQNPESGIDNLLETICKLRRRKSHLQKDAQNFFALFMASSSSLIFLGLIGIFGFSETNQNLFKSITVWFLLACFIFGIYFIRRLNSELHQISIESENPLG